MRRLGVLTLTVRAGIALLLVSAATALLAPPAGAASPLVGIFTITAGSCAGGTVTGSYFRMILQGGNASGPYLSNSDSTCSDQSYTPMSPGTDGGLASGSYQPQPSPTFDANGNSLADRIITPADFYGVRYGASSQSVDPQTGDSVPAPLITLSGTTLGGQVSALSVSWNNQYFNQGSPKPDGTYPGDTTPLTGTYDPATGSYTMQWTSQIVGGPFNGFSGLWVLTGRFVAAGEATASSAASSGTRTGSVSGAAGSTATSAPSSSGQTAGTSSTPTTPAATATPSASASSPGAHVLAVRTSTRSGLDPPRWLVGLVAALAVLALVTFVYSDRRIRAGRATADAGRGSP